VTLAFGSRIGSYEVTAKVGEGGMGEVYQATDSQLDREVALKVLPEDFTQDAERLARFEREAKLLAQLNHPNIAQIYGIEVSDETRALVMELVEGPTLAERLEAGPLPLEEALSIARKIAEALEEAHEKGIIHRDLKPQNIKASLEGKVKVLDFGLAKALDPSSAVSGSGPAQLLSESPTLTMGATVQGVILGTAAYMAPEQAKGIAVDKRADIWAFGVVLYEMLTGARLFAGDTLAETMAEVLKTEVDLGLLPDSTPESIRRLLRRCLERSPKVRLRDIGEARIAIDMNEGDGVEPAMAQELDSSRKGFSPLLIGGALALVALLAGWVGWKAGSGTPSTPAPTTEFSFWVEDLGLLAISPDGGRIAYSDGSKLFVRDLDDRLSRQILDDEELRDAYFSPDGSELAVVLDERLTRLPVAGGNPSLICELPKIEGVPARGALDVEWKQDGTIFIAAWRGGLYHVSALGGEPELIVPIDPAEEVDFHRIDLLPDGESLLLNVHGLIDGSDASSSLLSLYRDGKRQQVPLPEALPKMWFRGYTQGHVLAQLDNPTKSEVWAIPFDPSQARFVGSAQRFLLETRGGDGAEDGSLVYAIPKKRPGVVVLVDSGGSELDRLGKEHDSLRAPTLSPNGSKLALIVESTELWVHDLERDTLTRLVQAEDHIDDPQWSPDGRVLYYTDEATSGFRKVRPDPGALPETVIENAVRSFIAPNGSGVLTRPSAWDLSDERGFFWIPFDAQGNLGERRKILGGFNSYGRLSPTGSVLGYSAEGGDHRDAFVTNFPDSDQTIQLSSGGGGTPRWSPDGSSVYYIARGKMIQVEVELGSDDVLRASPEKELFDIRASGLLPSANWGVDPQGRGFLFVKSLATDPRTEVVVRRNAIAAVRADQR
jgi:serine/threonine-protein kinase